MWSMFRPRTFQNEAKLLLLLHMRLVLIVFDSLG